MISLELPVPPSANRIWRVGKNRVYVSDPYRAWLKKTRILIYNQYKGYLLTEPVSVVISWYRSAERGDLDNKIKPTLDALKRLVIKDDKQVHHIHASVRAAKKGRDALYVHIYDSPEP